MGISFVGNKTPKLFKGFYKTIIFSFKGVIKKYCLTTRVCNYCCGNAKNNCLTKTVLFYFVFMLFYFVKDFGANSLFILMQLSNLFFLCLFSFDFDIFSEFSVLVYSPLFLNRYLCFHL